jgi:hypothetical protein
MVVEDSAERYEVYKKRVEALEKALLEAEASGTQPSEPDPVPLPFLLVVGKEGIGAPESSSAEGPDSVGGNNAEATRLKVLERLL